VTSTESSAPLVLAVDDQPENLMLVEEILGDAGIVVCSAEDGVAAIRLIDSVHPDCVVLDVMMPRMDGIETCRRLKTRRETRFIPVVMLTALTSVQDRVRAFDAGADDFLNKPVDARELVRRVRSMVRLKGLRDALDTSESIVFAMAEALENSDPVSAGHSRRVLELAILTGRRIGLPETELEVLGKAALLHDIGKTGMNPEVLAAHDARVTPPVREYRLHPERGEQILAPFLSFARIRSLIRHHHERRDGSGFPGGLKGDELDRTIEILALANHADGLAVHLDDPAAVADALTAAADAGQFGKDLVDAFLETRSSPRRTLPEWSQLMPRPRLQATGHIVVACSATATLDNTVRALKTVGHQVSSASDLDALSELVVESAPDLIVLDAAISSHRDPDEVARGLRQICPRPLLPILLMTTAAGLRELAGSAAEGVDDVLVQPIDRTELVARAGSLVRQGAYLRDLEERHSVILGLASALEAKDPYTRGHSERVGILAARLGVAMQLSEGTCRTLRIAGQLHDIGKIGLPAGLLNKKTELSSDEYEAIKRHPNLTARICQPLRTLHETIPLARHHHERFDGSGYPDGLAGEEIPFGARILGMADAFDALTSARSYRSSFARSEALDVLQTETEVGRWDPQVFAALKAIVQSDEPPPQSS